MTAADWAEAARAAARVAVARVAETRVATKVADLEAARAAAKAAALAECPVAAGLGGPGCQAEVVASVASSAAPPAVRRVVAVREEAEAACRFQGRACGPLPQRRGRS